MSADGAWVWRYDDAADDAPASPKFPTQADAESWLGEEWRSLLSGGVEAVHLLEGDRHVYGPMSLRPQT